MRGITRCAAGWPSWPRRTGLQVGYGAVGDFVRVEKAELPKTVSASEQDRHDIERRPIAVPRARPASADLGASVSLGAGRVTLGKRSAGTHYRVDSVLSMRASDSRDAAISHHPTAETEEGNPLKPLRTSRYSDFCLATNRSSKKNVTKSAPLSNMSRTRDDVVPLNIIWTV